MNKAAVECVSRIDAYGWPVSEAGSRGEELHEAQHSIAWAYWKWQDILAQKSCSRLEQRRKPHMNEYIVTPWAVESARVP